MVACQDHDLGTVDAAITRSAVRGFFGQSFIMDYQKGNSCDLNVDYIRIDIVFICRTTNVHCFILELPELFCNSSK